MITFYIKNKFAGQPKITHGMNSRKQDSWTITVRISVEALGFIYPRQNDGSWRLKWIRHLINLLSGWIDASADHFLNFLFPKEESLYKRRIRILRAKSIFRFRRWDIFSRNRSHSGILKRVILPSYRYWEYWRQDQASIDGVCPSIPLSTCP